MTKGLANTILASGTLAAALNLWQVVSSVNQSARDSFSPAWAEAAAPKPVTVSPAPSPAASPEVSPATAPAGAPAPPPTPDPNANRVAAVNSRLINAGLHPWFAANYLAVEAKTGTPWQLLAAVHYVETGQSGDTSRSSYAGATGPMQFMPATFARYAADGDGDGAARITDVDDALLSAGRYLATAGASKGYYTSALLSYNHSTTYASNTLAIARRLGL